MNYIKQLQEQLKQSEQSKENAQAMIREFRKHLTSSKYHCGNDLDNYICVTDVHNWLDRLFSASAEQE